MKRLLHFFRQYDDSTQLAAHSLAVVFFTAFFLQGATAQISIVYPQQTGNYYTSFVAGTAGYYNQNLSQIGTYANGGGTKQFVAWRKFRTDGTGSATGDRALQVGDQFILRLSATRAYGRIGFALLCSPTTTPTSWANRISNYAIQFNLDGPAYNAGNWGSWYVVYSGGATSTGSANISGTQTNYKDFTFTLTLTAPGRMNASWTDGSVTSNLYDIPLNSSSAITDYSIFLEDDWDGGGNRNVFWGLGSGLQHSVTNAGVLNHGLSNSSYTLSAVLFNGLNANSVSANDLSNRFEKNGTGTLTLTAANTYRGSTTVNAGVLSTSLLANGGSASGIGQSTSDEFNLLLATGTTLQYTGPAVNSDRLLTLNGSAAGHVSTIDASGSGALNLTNTGSIAFGTGNQSRTLILTGSNSGNNTLSALISNNGSGPVNITKAGSGTWLLANNANFYQGVTTINAGVLSIPGIANGATACAMGRASNASANLVLGGGTLRYTGATASTDRGFTISAGTSGTFDISTAGTQLTISGSAAATTGSLTKNGAGTLVLSGNNAFTGGVTINAGTLQAGSAGALNSATPNNLTMGGGTLSLNGNNIAVASLSGTSGAINNGAASNAVFTVNSTLNTSYSGSMANGSTGTLALTKSGSGTLTLNGTNTCSGTTTISGGTLLINNSASLSSTSNLVFNGGGLAIGSVGTAVNLNAGTINLQGGNTASLDLGSGSSTFNLWFANSSAVSWNVLPASPTPALTIFNWTPTAGKRIFVGATGLTAAQLSRINFDNYGVGAKIVGNELRPAFLYVTNGTGSGNFNLTASWLLGDRPTALNGTESIYIQPNDNLVLDASVANPVVLSLTRVELGNGATVTMGNHTLTIASGGDFRTSGTVSMTSSSVINLPANSSMTVGNATASFTAAGTINCAGAFTFVCNSPNAVSLPNVNISAGVDFGQNSTIAGGATLSILANGFVSNNAPLYGAGSTLAYNTGGSYNRNLEWSSTSGKGYPHHVLVGTTTQLNVSNGTPGTSRQISGDLTINANRVVTLQDGAGMSAPLIVLGNVNVNGELRLGNAFGGDLRIGGNYNYGAAGTVFNNNRAVVFTGSTDQFVTRTGGGIVYFDFLVVDKPAGDVKLTTNTNATIISAVNNDPTIRVLQLLRGGIDLNDGTLTLEGANAQSLTLLVSGGTRRIYTGTGTGDFRIQGSVLVGAAKFTVATETGGRLLFDNNVTVSTNVGVNFGAAGITTINSILRIDANGFVITNSPDYGASATLVYNNGSGGYKRNMEWNTDNPGSTGAGYPANIIVQNNTAVELNSLDFPAPSALGCSGNLTIDAGSTLTTNALASPFTGMTFPLTVSGNLTINGSLILSTNSAGVLNVGGNWSRTGTFVQNDRNVNFFGAADATLTASGGQNFSFMTLAKTGAFRLTLNNNVAITDTLGLLSGKLTLNNSGISIVSTAAKTARIGVSTMVPADITYTGTNGKFFIQRYVPARRSWRLVTTPFRGSGSSINTTWQEDQAADFSTVASAAAAVAADTSAGYGTQITGGALANGFDQGQFNNASLKFFSGGAWQNFNTNTRTTAANSQEGWMLFVRGDRKNYGQITTANKPATITTLRPRGEIHLGSKAITSTGLTVVGNPYASAVDFTTTTKTGALTNTYTMWDPYLTGSSGNGAFVTLTWNGSSFVRSVPSTIDDRYIPSGAAIMVNFGAGGTLTFRESDKASSATTAAFRPAPMPILRMVLHTVQNDSLHYVSDGNIVLYDDAFSDEVDAQDAIKVNNFSENFSMNRKGVLLSVERRRMPTAHDYDTVSYSMRNMRFRKYRLALSMQHLAVKPGTALYLEDNFLRNKMALPLNDSSNYDFSVTSDSGSFAANRFRLVFEPLVRFISLEAIHSGDDNLLTWEVSRPVNGRYVIERSNDGISFTAIDSLYASGVPGSPLVFSHADKNPSPGVYSYRIRCVGPHQVTLYSGIVKLVRMRNNPQVYVFPNPVSGNRIGLQMNHVPAGVYTLRLFNSLGQTVISQTLQHRSMTTTHWITPSIRLASGTYRMQLTGPTRSSFVLPVVVNGDE